MPPSYQSSIESTTSSNNNNPADDTVKQYTDTTNSKDDIYTINKLKEMHKALPTSTQAECRRFLIDRKGNTKAAIDKLQYYLEWRKQHVNDVNDELSHLDSWTYATQIAMNRQARITKKGNSINDIYSTTYKLPCPLFMYEHKSSTSTNIDSTVTTNTTRMKYIQHLPARIDLKLADISTYALALALYIDHILDRNSTEKATLIIDVRPGYGWSNINAIQLLPFIQMVSKLLCDLFPTRLERCIVYPVPKMALFLWKTIQPFVGSETVDKIKLISGPAGKKDKVPTLVSKYLDEELITKLEERRTSLFTR